jgi:hypothetical protein
MKSRRKFTKEFKLTAIRRLQSGHSAAEVARALEVNPNVPRTRFYQVQFSVYRRYRLTSIRPCEIGLEEFGVGEVRSNPNICLPPIIPTMRPLHQPFNMVQVSHED